jgi:hypothetical protein
MSHILAVLSPVEAVPEHDGSAPSALDLSTSAVSVLIEEAELTRLGRLLPKTPG